MCLVKDKFSVYVKSSCFCSDSVDTMTPLKYIDRCMGLFFLQENITWVACFVGSGLNTLVGWYIIVQEMGSIQIAIPITHTFMYDVLTWYIIVQKMDKMTIEWLYLLIF